MSRADGSDDRIEIIRERVEGNPDAATVEDVVTLIEHVDASERRRLVEVLDRKLAADPSTVPDLLRAVDSLFDHEIDDVRTVAATIVERISGRYPDRATPAIDRLAELVHDDSPFARHHAVWALAHISDREPALVAPLVPTLRPADDEPPYFEHEHVVTILENVSTTDLDAITPLIPALLELLEGADEFSGDSVGGVPSSGTSGTIDQDQFKEPIDAPLVAAELVADIGRTEPHELKPFVDDLIEVLETVSRRPVRREVVDALGGIAETDPEGVEPAIPALATALDATDVALQVRAAQALGFLAPTAPTSVTAAVEERVEPLAPILREGTPPARGSVAGLFSYVAEENPAAIAPAIDALIAALDTDAVYVRASAAIALGYAGGADARGALVTLLDDDLEPEIREPVREAIERIDSRTNTSP
ncbi:HEAT repeat domain-containing protein [Halomontanus rarus]|uniref:HEAT repeat domain-containing protein n=1 Tax=Halomontanus rarus TaxID=3034020 RepID=UPI0023E797CF|nr:hypothetical protein [Halovivax sp. TS33]